MHHAGTQQLPWSAAKVQSKSPSPMARILPKAFSDSQDSQIIRKYGPSIHTPCVRARSQPPAMLSLCIIILGQDRRDGQLSGAH